MTGICKNCSLQGDLNNQNICDICENKTNILDKLKKDRNKLNEQIEMIENLKIEPVTEKVWHELCQTPLRYNDILLDIAEVTFPEGDYFERHANEVSFEINGFDISIPTSLAEGITIDMKWYKPYILEDFKPQNRYKKMRRYFELIDRGNCKWHELAEVRCNAKFNKTQLFIWWFLEGKWHKVNRKEWEKRFSEEDTQNKENCLKHKKAQEEMLSKIKEFHEVVDILKDWAEVKGYVRIDGVYSTTNIENFLR